MILNFDEVKDLSKVGNKAASLIEMKRQQFPVPNGFVIDRDTYWEILRENRIETVIDDLLKQITPVKLSNMSVKIRGLFDGLVIGEGIRAKIMDRLSPGKLYAVRSSGTKEDLEAHSFAGQYETFLNVEAENVIERVVDCYRSMFSEVILSYFLNRHISFEGMGMTVIVQEMVASQCSGICFTLNPLTGNDREMLIEVGEGLGENIVSGKVAPEQYYFNWYEGTYRYEETNRLLKKSLLERMTKLFGQVQLYFGYPCDIEFGICDDAVYVLQARKITKIMYQGIRDIWSTADFKDGGVSATVCTPYMWSLYEFIWEYTLRKFILDSKILTAKEVDGKLGEMFYGRCYWNLSVVKNAMSKVVGYKEREFDSEYGIRMNYEGDGATTRISLKSIAAIVRMALAQNKILKTRNKNAVHYKEELLGKYNAYKTAYDSGDKEEDIRAVWKKLIFEDYLQSESTYFWQIFINTIHQSLYKDGLLRYVSESEYLTLLGSIENISHLLPFYDMWNISRKIRKNEEQAEYWRQTPAEEIVRRLQAGAWMPEVEKLISDYGYHSDKELDVTYPCYYEDITPLVITLKDMVSLEDRFSPMEDQSKGKEAYEGILKSIEKQVSGGRYKKIKEKVEKMRKMLWWREEFRDISTRFYYIIRIYTVKLAEALVQEEVLEQVGDIWFLKIADIWQYLEQEISREELLDRISKNRTYYQAYRNYMSENEIGAALAGGGDAVAGGSESGKQDGIRGLGANNGVVEGTARVIKSFEEIGRLEKGDILVTRFTDTGWTPKFAILSGIVTEYGGILCHAAIVSREYGIPAIVSCHDVMGKIQDGQRIRMDGTSGIVTILGEDK